MNRVKPHQHEPGQEGQVLTTVAGEAVWLAPNVLLIDNGATVPADTPVGTIIFEKGV